jgi:hypothetical protein
MPEPFDAREVGQGGGFQHLTRNNNRAQSGSLPRRAWLRRLLPLDAPHGTRLPEWSAKWAN